ncbi:MAG: hypothetical protein FJ000_02220 [Actinobacteria bacterium]|nr:hypothetical protein [Actinomycetota bacterium]
MKLLELLAPHHEPLSVLVAGLPTSTLVHRTVACPWSLKGTVMRTLTEELQKAVPDEVGLIDGIRVTDRSSWVQVLPDADEPVFHVYAEGLTAADSTDVAERFVERVRGIIERAGS